MQDSKIAEAVFASNSTELYEEFRHFFEMGDSVADGVFVVDRDGLVLGASSMIGKWSETDISGHFITDISSKKVITANEAMLRDLKPVTDVFWGERTGRKFFMTCSPFFNRNGGFLCGVTMLRDIAETLELSSQISRFNKHNELAHNRLKKYAGNTDTSLVGNSETMIRLKHTVERVAKTDATVLIQGETGSGKEVIARELHKRSDRAEKPFITINCAAIPECLLESELFGYVKGSFTGAANRDKKGLIEAANGGTLLLDEIGDMPLSLQAKLLRVLQEKQIYRIGDISPIPLDVRFLAATNCNLLAMIEEKKFRTDLYFRLNVVNITIPPLRNNKDDIEILSDSILKKNNIKYKKQCTLNMSALFALEQHDWPGNVRELENVIERLVLFGQENIGFEDVYDNVALCKRDLAYDSLSQSATKLSSNIDDTLPLRLQVREFERQKITDALQSCGSTRKAAKMLGMSQSSIMRRIQALKIEGWGD